MDVRRTIGMVFQRPNPFPTMSIYDNVAAGLKLQQRPAKKPSWTTSSRSRCARANLWDEVKDRLNRPGAGLSGGQQQRLCIARAHRGRTAGAADGRAVLGARPDLDPGDRGPDRRAEGRATRSSSSRTTCSRPRASPSGPAFFNLAGVGQPGQHGRDGRHAEDLLEPDRQANRGLHLWPVRLTVHDCFERYRNARHLPRRTRRHRQTRPRDDQPRLWRCRRRRRR